MAHHLFLNLLEIGDQLVRGGRRRSEVDQKAAVSVRVWVASADVDSLLLGRLHAAVASILCTSEVFQILPAHRHHHVTLRTTDFRRRVWTYQSLVGNLGDISAPTPHW